MKNYIILNLFLLGSYISNAQTKIINQDSTHVIIVEQDDSQMDSAIKNAQISLTKFDSALFSNNPRYNWFALKVRFAYGDDNGEHIWFKDITQKHGEYVGIVSNEPIHIKDISLNDTIMINRKDISDWMYLDADTLIGGFTIRLLRNRMPQKERDEFDSSRFYKIEN